MRSRAGIIGLVLLGWALTAHAQTSPYTSMAVVGDAFTNQWGTIPNLTLVADNTWQGIQEITNSNGSLKFVANGDWTTNWGGSASIVRVPAVAATPTPDGGNIQFTGLTPGLYQFTFNDSTLEFQMEWAGGAPLPIASVTNMAIVGDFNAWTESESSRLTNDAVNTNQWTGSIILENATGFRFQANGNVSNQWGAAGTTTLNPPVTNGNAGGVSLFNLTSFEPGIFLFTLDVSNNTFTISQTVTQSFALSTLTVQGSFIATNNPPPNMMKISSSLWQSDHFITNNGAVTLRFACTNSIEYWGGTNASTSYALPATGYLQPTSTNFIQVTGLTTGRYRILFDQLTGVFSFRQSYEETAGINLFENPGFETTTLPEGGDALPWLGSQSWPKQVADGFPPHSGNWCGVIHGVFQTGWDNFGSFSQDVLVTSGKTYRASAWFRASPEWVASTMQIKVEWLNATNGSLGEETTLNIPALTTDWVKYSVQGTAPSNASIAHVVFLCAGADSFGTMQIDDAEFSIASDRTQNFDTWGVLTNFAAFSPDWSVTSGRVIQNVPPGRPPATVMISQYVEGTGNNKAIEIYNGTRSNINLAAEGYVLQQYNNGSLSPSVSIFLTGILPENECLVFGRPDDPTNYAPNIAISGLPNLVTNKYITFNGDDVIVLRQGGPSGARVDRVGLVATNATGSFWSRTAQNHTLRRNPTIYTGTVSGISAEFPLDEWIMYDNDDFTDLGQHDLSFTDPNEPYTPAGYSLLLNTNAILMSGELPGGLGDVSFWSRTESMSPPVTISIESAPSESGPWTTNDILENIASSNFSYSTTAINQAGHLYLRFRQIDGGTNRFRIDEINVSEYSINRRFEDFNAWTDPIYASPGDYSRYGWSILNDAVISPNGGVSATRAALISPTNGEVLTPAFEGGVGEVVFYAEADDPSSPARLLLQTTIDGGSNWFTQGTYSTSTDDSFATWLYITNFGAQARIVFDPSYSSGDVLIDNVDIRAPALYRNQNFNGWPATSDYATESHQGWSIANCAVDSQYARESQAARLNSTVGSYIQGPYMPEGVGTFSFWMRKINEGDSAANIEIQLSDNGTAWTTFATVSPASAEYEEVTFFVGTQTNYFLRLYHSSGNARLAVDDIVAGEYQPRPEVIITPGLTPSTPLVDVPMRVTASVITRYGATVLSADATYHIESSPPISLPMSASGVGSYLSNDQISGLPAGTMIRYRVAVEFGGIGAAVGSTGYSITTNYSAWTTNYVSTVPDGDVWINEIFYAPYLDEPFETNTWTIVGQNHEYIELCGVNGTSISNWTIELVLGDTAAITANGGQPLYASYTISEGYTFTDETNGYSFYVLGDQQLTSNSPINKVLTTTVPTNVYPFAIEDRDHIYDGIGVVRLLNEYGNVVYSLSYAGYADGSDRIPQSQKLYLEHQSMGLAGTGSTYDGFEWFKGNMTIGEVNSLQELDIRPPDIFVYAYGWHVPSLLVTPVNTNAVSPFHMLNPYPPAHYDNISIAYGYTNVDYPSAGGILYHRADSGSWDADSMSIYVGSLDAEGHAYVRSTIPAHTYKRLQTLEYVIQVDPNKTGVQTVYLGLDGETPTVYTNLATAQVNPYTYLIPIADTIYITNVVVGTTNTTLWTSGNDPIDPLVNFYIQTTTNLLTPTDQWVSTNYTGSTNIYGEWTFNIRKTTNAGVKLFYRVDPLWP
jgi:Lamin Tail Domain